MMITELYDEERDWDSGTQRKALAMQVVATKPNINNNLPKLVLMCNGAMHVPRDARSVENSASARSAGSQ